MLFLGLTAFLLQLQLLYILRHLSMIAKLEETLKRSFQSLLSSVWLITIITIAFISLFLLFYGSTTEEYNSFMQSSKSLIIGTMGKFKYQSLISTTGTFGSMMFMVYLFLQGYIFTNLMCTVLIDYLNFANQLDFVGPTRNTEIIQYMVDWMKRNFNPFESGKCISNWLAICSFFHYCYTIK